VISLVNVSIAVPSHLYIRWVHEVTLKPIKNAPCIDKIFSGQLI